MSTDSLDSFDSFDPPPTGLYQYKPFSDDHSFRLLWLYPPTGDGGIEGSMLIAEAPFHQPPISYEAISYVWGKHNDDVDIICDGHTLTITSSLADALRRVRLADRVRVLWADGVCINQKDNDEKIGQVKMMAMIYMRASRVLAWIGRDDTAETASRLIRKLRPEFEDAMEGTDKLILRDVMDAQDQADLEFVVRMFRKPLFSRVWIIQELGSAADITFLYGDFEINRIDVFFFVDCMTGSQDLYELEHYTDYEKIYFTFRCFRPDFYKNEPAPGFLEILVMAQDYGASEPRDHVFALLGHHSAYVGGSDYIKADYTKPLSLVLTQVTTQLLLQNKSLRPLSAVHHDESDLNADYPSWVPPLHKAPLVSPFGMDERYYYTADAGAAGAEDRVFRISSDGVLTVCGLVFDTISSASPKHFTEAVAATEPRMMQAFREALALSRSQAPLAYESSTRLEAFGITMVAGLFEYSATEDDIARHRANFAAYMIQALDAQPDTRQKLALARDERLGDDIKTEALNGNVNHFVRDANVIWSGRRFFCTRRGFFGLGPKTLKRGDLCCVLFGARVPFILRKVKNRYRLIGESYLHGIMRGEAIDTWQKGELQVQAFDLH